MVYARCNVKRNSKKKWYFVQTSVFEPLLAPIGFERLVVFFIIFYLLFFIKLIDNIFNC